MGISFGSINTGLPKDIVKQIINAERIPIKGMNKRKGNFEEKKKLVGELTKLVEGLRDYVRDHGDTRSFQNLKSTGNDEILGITIDDATADIGEHTVEVLQLARKSSAMSSPFEDPDKSYVGVGYIGYSLPNGDSREVFVDNKHASLNGIAKLINADKENGLKASVINDGKDPDRPWRIILSAAGSGDTSKVEWPFFDFIDGVDDFYIEFERPAQDGKIKVDGFEIEVSDNTVKDVIPGVTLDLKKAQPGEEVQLGIAEDTEATTDEIGSFIDNINSVFDFINTQNKMDEKTNTSKTLGGDIVLQTLGSRIRSTIFSQIDTKFGPARVGDLGVTFGRDGRIEFDNNKFQSFLKNNPEKSKQILVGHISDAGIKTPGFMDKMKDTVSLLLRYPDGILPSRTKGIQSKIDQIDRRIDQRERMIKQKEKRLKEKFARLEGTISKIKSQGAGLSALGGGGGGASAVTQLG